MDDLESNKLKERQIHVSRNKAEWESWWSVLELFLYIILESLEPLFVSLLESLGVFLMALFEAFISGLF